MSERTYFIARAELLGVGFSPAATRQFEDMQERLGATEDTAQSGVEATGRLQDATFLTLSSNAELPNERVLEVGPGLSLTAGDSAAKLELQGVAMSENEHSVRFVTLGDTLVVLPLVGTLVSRDAEETLANKTIDAPLLSGLTNAADDTAAAAAGVPVGGVYRDGSVLMVRVA